MDIWIFYAGFTGLILLLLLVDLGLFHRKAHAVSLREAAISSAVWISLGLAFCVFVYHAYEQHWLGLGIASDGAVLLDGAKASQMYLLGYLIEKSLSVDNVFVFALIFTYFAVPPQYQHRVLFWGILGALVMRGAFIGAGAVLIAQWSWVIYIFGAFLLFTGVKMLLADQDEQIEPERNPALRLLRRLLPITNRYHGQRFFVRSTELSADAGQPESADHRPGVWRAGAAKWVATPLMVVLVIVETTDLIFAVDSIPAIFGITQDPFIVYTSNVFAILGLRALYFLLAGVMHKFSYLKTGLALILVFIGIKMCLNHYGKDAWGQPELIPTTWALGVVGLVLSVAIIASLLRKPAPEAAVSPAVME